MKLFFQQIMNYYNTNTTFHSLIHGALVALIGAAISWHGGGKLTTTTVIAFLSFIGQALFSWFTRWAQINLATVTMGIKKDGIITKGV
jgi:hypothetical protein